MPEPINYKPSCIPTLAEPPIVHAAHEFDEDTHVLSYEYNGRKIIQMVGQGKDGFGYRHTSDGDIQSRPFIQQLYFVLDEPKMVQVTFHLSKDVICMRPRRAGCEESIIGHVGRPLLFGVNGLYDIEQDLLIEWCGKDWKWLDDELWEDENGELCARLEVEISQMPWFMNLRMQYYRTHLGYTYHKPWEFRPNTGPVAGWCSWEAYRRDVTEENVAQSTAFLAEKLGSYGMEYIQIDDGFQKMPIPVRPEDSIASSWLTTNDQFPSGHDAMVKTIESYGMKAGIWTSASMSNKEFAKAQPEFVIADKDGKFIEGDWLGFVLDCTPKTLAKHVEPYYRGLKEMGYQYFKTDQIRHLLYDGLQKAARLGVLTNEEVEEKFRAFIRCARENIGDDCYFLASWGVLSQVVGIADACRIAIDANPTWAGVRMQLVESARWFHTNRILFVNDPDHICARAKLEWARSLISLVSLSGGLFMLSDPLEAYDDDRIEIIRKCLPPLPTVTGETGPLDMTFPAFTWTKLHGFAVPREKPVAAETNELEDAAKMAGIHPTMHNDHPFSSLWSISISAPGMNKWCVVGRFATSPLRKSMIPLKEFGVDPKKEYVAFDFWAENYLGRVRDKISVPELDLGHCQVIALREALDHPQFLASSRHISMDAVSVKSEKWTEKELVLELKGIPNTTETYWFHVPSAFTIGNVAGEGLTATFRQEGELVSISVSFEKSEGLLTLRF